MASLQEQLLKAGLTTKHKARQANTDQRKKNKQKRSGVKVEESVQEQVKKQIAASKKEKLAKDQLLNDAKKKELEQKELTLRIRQILQHHQVKNILGENEYNYTYGSKVKKLHLNDISQKALINGRLALCGLDDITYVVTRETAVKLAELDESVILLKNDKVEDENINEDDPYADYQIPDDLMW